jgi:methyltransferase (TIGR00027 family)
MPVHIGYALRMSMASRTALGVAVLRAAHQVLDGRPLILEDPIALPLLDADTRAWVWSAPAELQSAPARGLRGHVVTRSRVAEDRLLASLSRGVTQYVILGAGYDTFAYRQPEATRSLRIVEVDQAGTQQDKRQRLAAAQIAEPANVQFASVDFTREDVAECLRAEGVDGSAPTCFSWLGVSMYLDAASNDAVFRYVARQPVGSELVFTFAPAVAEGADSPGRGWLAEQAAQVGEPWKTFYDPPALARHLQSIGFSSVWMPAPAELAAAYFLDRPDDLPLPRRRTLVAAVV